MLTLAEVNRREPRCRRCGCTHDLILPPLADKEYIYSFRDREAPVAFIGYLREATGCSRREAEATYNHLSHTDGSCHQCRTRLPEVVIADCPTCNSVNLVRRDDELIDLTEPTGLVQPTSDA
jgi:hypothetical protein